ncbi:SRPBCC family protein [Amycolatopsis sp. NPDC059027]|uniref:SRPBCC family protein n=1 Tax=unclassified Amycolatopsis TaxID=2618356 RepID=UPI00366DFCF9
MTEPTATGLIEIGASPDRVYDLVSDPGKLAGLAEEYSGHQWLGGASAAAVGARFRGNNRRGPRRWSTIATITDADPGKRFAFDVTFLGLPISRWQYDIEQEAADRCVVTESTWERRPGWLKLPTSTATGVWRRAEANRANIAATLARLKTAAELA